MPQVGLSSTGYMHQYCKQHPNYLILPTRGGCLECARLEANAERAKKQRAKALSTLKLKPKKKKSKAKAPKLLNKATKRPKKRKKPTRKSPRK